MKKFVFDHFGPFLTIFEVLKSPLIRGQPNIMWPYNTVALTEWFNSTTWAIYFIILFMLLCGSGEQGQVGQRCGIDCLDFHWFILLILFVYLFTYLFIYLFIYIFTYLFIYLPIYLFLFIYFYLFFYLFLFIYIYLFSYLFLFIFIN